MLKQHNKRLIWAMSLLGASLSMVGTAHADTVSGTKLYESTTLVTQSQIDLQTLNLTGAGTVSIKLTDLKWPDLLGALSFTLFDATHVIGSYALEPAIVGSNAFNVNTAGTYYASIYASPTAGKSGGLYNAQIYFQATAPVPLPAAGWLLFTGLAGLAAIRPKHTLSQMCA
jgi:hypothetical protein